MTPLRLLVTVVVATPLFLIVGWPHDWWVTFLIALAAISAGYGVEAVVSRKAEPGESTPAEKTSTDRDWERKMLLKKALTAEKLGQWKEAATLFEQILAHASSEEEAASARQHLEEARKRLSPPGGA